jgi:hypothetical protein
MNHRLLRPTRRGPRLPEIQQIYFSNLPVSGTYTINIEGYGTTTPIPFNERGEGEIEALLGIDGNKCDTSGAGTEADPYIYTFHKSLGNLPQMTLDTSSLIAIQSSDTGWKTGSGGEWTNAA